MFEKWKLGTIAYNAFAWARDVAQNVDPDAAIRILFKVVEIERERRGVPGVLKAGELLDWFRANYPTSSSVGVVAGYAKTLVALLNAIGVFRRSGKV